MYGTSGTLILCLFGILVNVANAEDSKFITAGEASDEDVNSLLEITSEQALPVIMFETENSPHLEPLVGLRVAEVKDGRIASGTTFYSRSSESQIFFCPKSESQTCLAPKPFEESEALECDVKPVPSLVDYGEEPCGATGTGTHLRFLYELCPAEQPYSYDTYTVNTYNICYDKPSNRVLQVGYTIVAADLFQEVLFTKEREINFNMNTETYGHIHDNYYASLEAEIRQKPKYKLQMLVPTEDMALARSRETTQFFANYALQHGALTDLWDNIMGSFRNHAIKKTFTSYGRITGIVDIPNDQSLTRVGKSQKANIWITMMTDFTGTPIRKGLAVVMYNFITDGSKKKSRGTGTSQEEYIDKICGENLCVDNLKTMFNSAGTQGRCCQVTKDIYNLLIKEGEMPGQIEVLFVENINYELNLAL